MPDQALAFAQSELSLESEQFVRGAPPLERQPFDCGGRLTSDPAPRSLHLSTLRARRAKKREQQRFIAFDQRFIACRDRRGVGSERQGPCSLVRLVVATPRIQAHDEWINRGAARATTPTDRGGE